MNGTVVVNCFGIPIVPESLKCIWKYICIQNVNFEFNIFKLLILLSSKF